MTDIATNPAAPLLVVMMPALNEQATVADVIGRVPRTLPGVGSVRVLVIDDGSTDRTVELAQAAGAEVVSHGLRQGVGAAFQTGLSRALAMGADFVVNIDADGQFDPATIAQLIAPVVGGQADFTTASRFADPELEPEMPRVKRWGNRMMSRLISRLIGQKFHDVSCGMRCYSRRAAMSLNPIGDFTYTQEVFLNLAYKRMRMVEVPIAVRGQREHGKSRVASNLWSYAWKTLGIIFRCYRDYKPMRFFGRLAAVLMTLAVGLEGFFFWHYLATGRFRGQLWAGLSGAALLALGLLFLITGLIGDMLNRHRLYLEEVLYHLRNQRKE